MADEARKGVIIYTDSGNLKHENADSWNVSSEGDLYVFEGNDTVATYRNQFWYSVSYAGLTKPA